jgi:hypothetical protein
MLIPHSNGLYLVYVGLASRPLPPEGRENILTYNRVNKSWAISDEWLPTVDKFLEGITELYGLGFLCFASVLPGKYQNNLT